MTVSEKNHKKRDMNNHRSRDWKDKIGVIGEKKHGANGHEWPKNDMTMTRRLLGSVTIKP